MIHTVKKGETIISIAIDYRIPVQTLLSVNNLANPNIIFIGQQINIPGLPDPATIPYEIHVSIASRRLTLISQGKILKVYPIAVGKILTRTPIGNYVIVNREPNPGGPFGAMWLSLSKIHYGIHGTNDPSSIGKAVSLGCIRMYNQDVIELASIVPNGTRVIIKPS
ncbi:L,D-transpeptidase family protein [Metabacillus fastidiosus]|uniref:L,D-transpeptidase family protein n=1 Tax=Metabacillus fastidiosus TaxID=1458 RepID=UPI002DC04FF1|nr:L,D-transpeptidase family protein [Metabacillus fastidiosus]MEC2075182.1 L,D-transpeptidase family protein [Metabacillus fastidiosus]